MALPRLKYFEAKSVDEAVSLLATYGDKAKIFAGGVDLLGAMKDRVLVPEVIVNIKNIEGLDYIKEENDTLKIGALTKLRHVERCPIVKDRYNLLAEAAHSVGSPQIRNMGTLGGNLCQGVRCWYYRASPWCGAPFPCYRKGGDRCYAANEKALPSASEGLVPVDSLFLDGAGVELHSPSCLKNSLSEAPACLEGAQKLAGDTRYHSIIGTKVCHAVCPSDTAPALIALGAKLKVIGSAGERMLSVEEVWLSDAPWLALGTDEIVTEIQVPAPKGETRGTYLKFRLRKAIDFALVSVAIVLAQEDGLVKDARVVLGGVAPIPWRAYGVEAVLQGKAIDDLIASVAGAMAVMGASPLAANGYKVSLARVLVKQSILSLESGCKAGQDDTSSSRGNWR